MKPRYPKTRQCEEVVVWWVWVCSRSFSFLCFHLLVIICLYLFFFFVSFVVIFKLCTFVVISLCYPFTVRRCFFCPIYVLVWFCLIPFTDLRVLHFKSQETETKPKEIQGESLESLVVERDELLAVASLGDLKVSWCKRRWMNHWLNRYWQICRFVWISSGSFGNQVECLTGKGFDADSSFLSRGCRVWQAPGKDRMTFVRSIWTLFMCTFMTRDTQEPQAAGFLAPLGRFVPSNSCAKEAGRE